MEPVGLLAGQGQFPRLVAGVLRAQGHGVVAIAHEGQTAPDLAAAVDAIHWIKVGQLGAAIRHLKGAGVRRAVMAGAIAKHRMFADLRPDFRGLLLLARVATAQDDTLLRAIAREFESEGITIDSLSDLLAPLAAPAGVLTARAPTSREEDDILFGWPLAKEMGRLDIGQTLVVKNKAVLAVEAIEGTDATIRRGGALGGPGSVVVKVVKPGQDRRFDAPVIGPETIAALADVGATVLAVEAHGTIVIDRDAVIARADAAGIAIVGLPERARAQGQGRKAP